MKPINNFGIWGDKDINALSNLDDIFNYLAFEKHNNLVNPDVLIKQIALNYLHIQKSELKNFMARQQMVMDYSKLKTKTNGVNNCRMWVFFLFLHMNKIRENVELNV